MQVIAPVVAPASATIPDELIPEDPFHDPRMKYIGILLSVMLLAGVFVMTAIYFGSMYGAPSWSSASVPPAIAHKAK